MNKQDTRLYGEKVSINDNTIKEFWNKRAEKYSDEDPYKSIKCNDKNKHYVDMCDEYEKSVILPYLGIDHTTKVLDIGCGVGRLAEEIIPKCNYYLGTDFAENLLEIAKKRIKSSNKCDFTISGFQEISENDVVQQNKMFNRVILAGVAMYINDEELDKAFEKLLTIVDEHCKIYISDSIATEERLTLKDFYSEEIESEYSVIYRTIDEYLNIFKVLFDAGFRVNKNERFLSNIKRYKETERHYFILER